MGTSANAQPLCGMCMGCSSYNFYRSSNRPHECKQGANPTTIRRDGTCPWFGR